MNWLRQYLARPPRERRRGREVVLDGVFESPEGVQGTDRRNRRDDNDNGGSDATEQSREGHEGSDRR